MRKMLIAGANGFIGRSLTDYFCSRGWEVVGLARREGGLHPVGRLVRWDGESLADWGHELNGCDVLINMVGRSIHCRHTDENKRQILASRIKSTRVLGEAVAACTHPPKLWINGSATGIYRASYDQALKEDGDNGEGFIADVVEAWENEFFNAQIDPAVRRVAFRLSMVLADVPGNPYQYLTKLAKLGLGGKAGSGRQMVSWVHIEDVVRTVDHLIGHEQISGPVNVVAPGALSNAQMMARFRKHVGMPLGLPAPGFGVRLGAALIGTAPELVLQSIWASPENLLDSGFEFKYPEMNLAEWDQ